VLVRAHQRWARVAGMAEKHGTVARSPNYGYKKCTTIVRRSESSANRSVSAHGKILKGEWARMSFRGHVRKIAVLGEYSGGIGRGSCGNIEAREKYKHLDKFKLETFFPWAATKGARGRADVSETSIFVKLTVSPLSNALPPFDAASSSQAVLYPRATRQPLFYNA